MQVRQHSQNLGLGSELLMAPQPHQMVWGHTLKTLASPVLPWEISIQQPLCPVGELQRSRDDGSQIPWDRIHLRDCPELKII
ncbi:unnamed protein product [Gulo gulo]|uniref:Uncharacterized protein n=1 Tax=Gulo gulo TaxID=48420 RepID=A0A9X9LF18_GULGU|nr:unnamed protein product [Gulo gulo]